MTIFQPNVTSFMEVVSEGVSILKKSRWAVDAYAELSDEGVTSPIEQLFYVACKALCVAHHLPTNPDPELLHGKFVRGLGIFIEPQFKIGRYKADFLISQSRLGPDEFFQPIVVELDGHEFHDRNKQQRSYEKARDRFFLKQGYRTIHYTGSDVAADPFRVAFEALEFVGLTVGSYTEEYDAHDPLGLGRDSDA